MAETGRKANRSGNDPRGPSLAPGSPATCPMTGISIPECSCRRCATEQIRLHAPWLLDRRFGNQRAA